MKWMTDGIGKWMKVDEKWMRSSVAKKNFLWMK